jgi:hypothetical protein
MPRVAKTSTSRELVNWDEELAKQAQVAAEMEKNAGGGQFYSIRAGQLSFNDVQFENSEIAVVILDSILENVFFEEAFDADNPAPPTCFAFGRDEAEMAPHEVVVEVGQAQNETCHGCPMNQWATANTGRGKACRNGRRMALLQAGTFNKQGVFSAFDDVSHFESGTIGFLKIPPTSVKGYAAFVKNLFAVLKRPPHGVFARIKVSPDAKTQLKVSFEVLEKVPNNLLTAIMARHHEARATIEQPYVMERDDTPAPPKRGARGKPVVNQRPPVKGKTAAKAPAAPVKVKKYAR